MTAEALIHREQFLIRSYEIDPQKRIAPAALVRLMQEASMQHVLKLKLSVWDLEPQGISWVLMRQQVRIHRLPLLGETIEVLTHPSGFERVFTHRDYRVFDGNGAEIAHASTTWLLMQTAARRMARIPPEMLAYNDLLPPASSCLPRAQSQLPAFEEANFTKKFSVNWFDLDFNFHLTNSKYVEWMLASADEIMLRHGHLKEIIVFYNAEAVLNDEVESQTCLLDAHTRRHRLVRLADGKELATGQSLWNTPGE